MPQYANLFNDLLKDALDSSIERVQLATPLVAEIDREEAWHLLSYALKEPTAWAKTRQLLLTLAPKMELAGFREEWIGYLTTAAECGRNHDDLAATAEFSLQTGLIYRMLTEYERAIAWLTHSLANFEKLDDRCGQARVFNELAWIEQLRRNYAEATRYVEQALALLAADDPERGMSYRVQGMIAIYRGEWQQAETHHRSALAIFEQQEDVRKVAWSMQNIAAALCGQKKFDRAIEKGVQACLLMKLLADDYHWSIAQMNLGRAYYYSGAIEAAISCYLDAETVACQLHDRLRLADIRLNLGIAYLSQGSNQLASSSFQSSIQLYKELDVTSMVVNAMDGLAMSYIAQHRHDQALKVLEEAISLLPQIVNVPNYQYYQQSLSRHQAESKAGLELSYTPQADIA